MPFALSLTHAKQGLGRLLSGPAAPLVSGTERLVPEPAFLLSSIRSGSTLLRVILDSHPQVCAPHEMHLGSLRVAPNSWFGEVAIEQLGVSPRDLENLLWDRVLHLTLARSGKSVVVDKTPYNTIDWERISTSWPRARYVFLQRHPWRIAQSLIASRPDLPVAEHYVKVNRYANALAQARSALPGCTVRYEELTADPERVVRRVCEWLDVRFVPEMLDYGRHDHGTFRRGVGDWGPKILSGHIEASPPPPDPDEIPPELRDACAQHGYL